METLNGNARTAVSYDRSTKVNEAGKPRVRCMITVCAVWFVLLGLTVFVMPPADARASVLELSPTYQKAWDKVLGQADAKTSTALKEAYGKAGMWVAQKQAWEQKIKVVHAANAAEADRLRLAIRQTDAAKLDGLISEVKQAEARYAPMFKLYETLNKQLKAARAAKNKEWTAAIRTQVESMKPVVQLARQDIRGKKQRLADARKQKNAKMKQLRSVLAGADAVKKQIQTAKRQAILSKERYSSALQKLKQTMKTGQAARTLTDAKSLATAAENWSGSQQRIHELELKVAAVYQKVRQQLGS